MSTLKPKNNLGNSQGWIGSSRLSPAPKPDNSAMIIHAQTYYVPAPIQWTIQAHVRVWRVYFLWGYTSVREWIALLPGHLLPTGRFCQFRHGTRCPRKTPDFGFQRKNIPTREYGQEYGSQFLNRYLHAPPIHLSSNSPAEGQAHKEYWTFGIEFPACPKDLDPGNANTEVPPSLA